MSSTSRREFMLNSTTLLGTAWLGMHWSEIEALAASARVAFEQQQRFQSLSPAEARTLSAFAEQIVPSDQLPGAREAGAIYFIDGALGGFAAPFKPLVQKGVKALDLQATRTNRRVSSFAALRPRQQIQVMKRSEKEDYFPVLRTLSVMGVFADPKYGGNRNQVGLRVLDMKHAPVYSPPFGYYDAQPLQTKARQP